MGDARRTRQLALIDGFDAAGIDALLVMHLPNIRWLTGFTGTAAMLLVAPDRTTLITDFRYATQAPQEAEAVADVVIDRGSVWDRFGRIIDAMGPESIGIESHAVTVREAERLHTLLRTRIVPLLEPVERLRQVKDAGEIAAIQRAGALAADALDEVRPTIRVGLREIDVAERLESALRRRGSEWHPFQTIVASGPRSALPHARSSMRVIERGDFLLIDFGAQLGGYCSDITRTMVMGEPDEKQRVIYDLVHEAQMQARTGMRAGMTGREADALARDVIAARGYGDQFGHSLGHGLGLEVHEAPRVAATAETVLPTGAVVTVEPGIYLEGWGGVRLEDDIWLSADGPVLLTDGRTDLLVLDP